MRYRLEKIVVEPTKFLGDSINYSCMLLSINRLSTNTDCFVGVLCTPTKQTVHDTFAKRYTN